MVMKKSLLGLAVALATFFGGVLITKVFNFENETVSNLPVKNVKIVEIPVTPVEPLKNAEEIQDEADDENVFSGHYQLDNFSRMEEVDMIVLSRYYGYHEQSGKIISSGGVLTSSGKNADKRLALSFSAEISNDQVKFKTIKIKEIEYKFEGVFFKDKVTGVNGEKVLRGTLQKFVKGKKVAEVSGDFAYYEPHCWL